MGKTLQNQDSGISLENTDPGCIKGLFHRFSYHKWNNPKRSLLYRRHSTGKLPAVGDSGHDPNNITNMHEEQGKTDDGAANSTEKLLEPGSRHKGSMKSRIKALIVEELSKRKVRHHRSSSLPSPVFERNPSIHHLCASDQDPQFKVQLEDERLDYQDTLHTSASSLLDPPLPNISDKSVTSRKTCNLCAATLGTRYFRLSEACAKRPVKDYFLPGDESIGPLEESKLSPESVDLQDIRKGLFLKVLPDPNSLFYHHLQAQKPSTQKLGLQKFASFPTYESFSKGVPILNNGENNEEVETLTEGETTMEVGKGDRISDIFAYIDELSRHSATCQCDHDEAPNHVVVWSKLLDNLTVDPQSSENQKNNELRHKHFKRLREKIKHSMEEHRKGRHRIIMDAILHKVPYGRRYWKNVREDGDNIHSDKMTEIEYNNGSGSRSYSPLGKIRPQRFSRTSSFNGPCERYNQLLDSHCNIEANSCTSDTSRLRTSSPSPIHTSPKLLKRILSLQDLRSYSFSRIEGTPIDYSSMSPMKPALACIPSIGSRRFCDSQAVSIKNPIQSTNSSENGSQENFVEGTDTFKDSGESERGEGSHHHNRFIESPLGSVYTSTPESDANAKVRPKSSTDPELMLQNSNLYESDTLCNLQLELSLEFTKETNVDSRVENPTCSSNKMRLDFEVDKRYEGEFNYVKDVLEQFGFSKNDSKLLGSRHWPVAGSVFAEVGAKLEEFPGNEGSGSCYKLVLFDLINQVLSEIHDRSLSYWPVPLTCRSRIHPIPIGHRVLEEVWGNVEGYLTPVPVFDLSFDDVVIRDLAKDDGWMNIQFEAEGSALELEDMIFHDLVLELVLPQN